jgi:hypothetical protein
MDKLQLNRAGDTMWQNRNLWTIRALELWIYPTSRIDLE